MIILSCAVYTLYTECFVLPVFKLSHFYHDKKYYNQNKCCYLCCFFFSPHCSSVTFSFHQIIVVSIFKLQLLLQLKTIQIVTSFYN